MAESTIIKKSDVTSLASKLENFALQLPEQEQSRQTCMEGVKNG